MNKEIKETIDRMTLKVIQFDTDIKNNNPEALNNFVNGLKAVLKLFKNLMLHPENKTDEYCLNFKNELSNVFEFLFIEGNIYNIADKSFRQNSENGIMGEIMAIKRNGNPFGSPIKKAIGMNPFNDFVSIYQGLTIKEKSEPEPVIEEKPMMKSKVCSIWCYAYYHFILETYLDKTKVFPYANKIKIAKISNKLYEIAGDQFYNEYHKLTKMRVLESIKNMNPKRREKLRESIIKLAKLYNSPSHIKWWDTTFIKTE